MNLSWIALAGAAGLAVALAACGGGDGGGSASGDCSFAPDVDLPDDRQFAQAPDTIIDASRSYVATISTGKGDIVVELYSDVPQHTNNFVFLACSGFYDGLTFHRVEPEFVIQGGDPLGDGTGGPGYAIPDEDDGDHVMDLGSISMAKAGPNTAGSQFFIVIGPRENVQHLDDGFTVFGEVTEGIDVAQQIAVGDTIERVTVEEQ